MYCIGLYFFYLFAVFATWFSKISFLFSDNRTIFLQESIPVISCLQNTLACNFDLLLLFIYLCIWGPVLASSPSATILLKMFGMALRQGRVWPAEMQLEWGNYERERVNHRKTDGKSGTHFWKIGSFQETQLESKMKNFEAKRQYICTW